MWDRDGREMFKEKIERVVIQEGGLKEKWNEAVKKIKIALIKMEKKGREKKSQIVE